jgi:putative ATP-binding cassette transporter
MVAIYKHLFKRFGLVGALSLAVSLISGLCTGALIAVINEIVKRERPLEVLIAGFIVLFALTLVSKIGSAAFAIRFAQKAILQLRIELARVILKAPLIQVERAGIHRLQSALIDDISVITNMIISIPSYGTNAMVVIFSIAYLGWLSWTALVVVICFAAVGLALNRLASKQASRHLRKARSEQDAMFKGFRGLLDGVKELRLHRGRRRSFMRHLEATVSSFRREAIFSSMIFGASGSWTQVMYFGVIGLLLFAGPLMRLGDSKTFIGATLVVLFMRGPLEAILSTIPALSAANVALNRITSLGLSLSESTKDAMDSASSLSLLPAAWRSVELLAVKHAYVGDERGFELGPLTVSFSPSEITFITGGNGSGKTTLIKLLCGLYRPQAGQIFANGTEISDANVESYRQLFSVVFYDFFLFKDLMGLSAADLDATASDYLVKLKLDHKVRVNGGVLSTIELSRGQRKRLALLTAYLEDRPVYVFDEWAADQDTEFKQLFYHQLLTELKQRGKALIVVTHDDHYFHCADRIIHLEDGRIQSDRKLHGGLAVSAGTEFTLREIGAGHE